MINGIQITLIIMFGFVSILLVKGCIYKIYEMLVKKRAIDVDPDGTFVKWIPTKTILPEIDETIIASYKENIYPIVKYTGDGWKYLDEISWNYWVEMPEPDAWMPPLAPYVPSSE